MAPPRGAILLEHKSKGVCQKIASMGPMEAICCIGDRYAISKHHHPGQVLGCFDQIWGLARVLSGLDLSHDGMIILAIENWIDRDRS